MIKILALDMDGVANSISFLRTRSYGQDGIDRSLLPLIVNILKKTQAKVLLSTSWRHAPELVNDIKNAFSEYNVTNFIIGQTPDLIDDMRGTEIKEWFISNKHLLGTEFSFAIIDDDNDAGFGFKNEFFFETDPRFGITKEIANKIIKHLNNTSILELDEALIKE